MMPQEVLARHHIRSVDIPDDGFLLADGMQSWIFYPKQNGELFAIESPFPFVAAYGSRMPIPWRQIFVTVYGDPIKSNKWLRSGNEAYGDSSVSKGYTHENEEETLEHFKNRMQSLR